MKKIAMVSLGCPKNRVDSEVILGLLGARGYSLTEIPEAAEIVIVNTCTFIEKATNESIEAILQYAALKTSANCSLLVVAGCLTQRYQEKLREELPEVDLFVGTGEYQRIADLVLEAESKGRVVATGVPEYIHDHLTPRISTTPFYSSYVKIAEGCSNPCTFCIIPRLRGDYRSREMNSIVEEIKTLVSKGTKEVNLVAQDTTAFGRDLDRPTTLKKLLEALTPIEGLQWIRLLYCYPTLLSDDLLDIVAKNEKVVNYIDLPLQHIDDNILKAMKRGTREKMIRSLLKRIRERAPEAALRSAFIIGFPGEGEKEFENLFNFIEEARFDHVGFFTYSREEGTAAAEMPGQVPEEVKEKRYNQLMELQQRISLEKNRSHLGKRVKVLVEGLSDETDLLLKGRTDFQAPEIDGITYISSGEANVGEIREALITDAHPYDLVAELIEAEGAENCPQKKCAEETLRP